MRLPPERSRATFLDLREIFERTLAATIAVRRELQELESLDERTRLFVGSLVNRRSQLEYTIRQGIAEAPDRLLNEYVQYAEDPARSVPSSPESASPDALVHWQTAADRALIESLRSVADRVEDPAAGELLANLADLIDAHDRRVAFDLESNRDI